MTEPVRQRTCGDAGGITKAGTPCRGALNLGVTGRCIMHDEARAAERAALAVAGGRGRKRQAPAGTPDDHADVPPEPKTLEDAVRWSSWGLRAMTTGRIDARTGHEIGYLVNAFKAAVEKRDLEKEIELLQAQVKKLKTPTHRPHGA